MRKAARAGVMALAAIGFGLGSFAGLEAWQQHEGVKSMRPHVKLATVHLSSLLDVDAKPENITYKEYFTKADVGIAEVDKAMLQIKSLSTAKTEQQSQVALDYMSRVQAVMRSMSATVRRQMLIANAEELAARHGKRADLAQAATAARIDALKDQLEALKDVSDLSEKGTEDAKATAALLAKLAAQRDQTASVFGGDNVIDVTPLEQAATRYKKLYE